VTVFICFYAPPRVHTTLAHDNKGAQGCRERACHSRSKRTIWRLGDTDIARGTFHNGARPAARASSIFPRGLRFARHAGCKYTKYVLPCLCLLGRQRLYRLTIPGNVCCVVCAPSPLPRSDKLSL